MPETYYRHPTTLDEAVDVIMSELTEEDKASIRGSTRENILHDHYMLGLYIGNSLGLWHGNSKLLVSCGMQKIRSLGITNVSGEYPFTDPYDSSCIILIAIWERLKKIDDKNKKTVPV
jgi:hypothetical protein